MRQRAADRAAVAHLLVGDQDAARATTPARACPEVGVPGHRADPPAAVLALDAVQAGHPPQVDQQRRRRQPQLHQRQQRVPAGEQLGVLAVLVQHADRLVEGLGRLVVERARDHAHLLRPGAGRPARPPCRPALLGAAAGPAAAWIACQTRIGVSGMSSSVTPSGASASSTAAATAGVAAIVPGLADALHAERVDRRGRLGAVGLDGGHLGAVGSA